MSVKINHSIILSVLIVVGFGFCNAQLFAQGGTGGTGGGQVGGDTGGQADGGQANTGQNTGSTGSGSTTAEGEGVGDLGGAIELDEFSEDTRNQGFIGSSATRIQEFGFVGRPSVLIGPPLSEGASLGGGVNDSVGSTVNIGGGGGNARGGGAAGFGAASNGVTITRRSMRSKVRPNFSAPRLNGAQVSNRFDSHYSLQPGSQFQRKNYSINIQNRTAFLNGSVTTLAESERLVRQLRLEPGVYKIVNQLQISN